MISSVVVVVVVVVAREQPYTRTQSPPPHITPETRGVVVAKVITW
jgi:hypothetical protein